VLNEDLTTYRPDFELKTRQKSFSTSTRVNVNHAQPMCKFMHIWESAPLFSFAAALELAVQSGREIFGLSEEQPEPRSAPPAEARSSPETQVRA
jgi:hypothetical protein